MASYVQLGRGFRRSYDTAVLHRSPRRRTDGRGVAGVLAAVALIAAAGLLLGRLNAGPDHARPAAAQPMQFYPR